MALVLKRIILCFGELSQIHVFKAALAFSSCSCEENKHKCQSEKFKEPLLTFPVTFSRFRTSGQLLSPANFPPPVSHTDSVDTSTALLTCFNQYFRAEATVKLQQTGLTLQQLGAFKNQCVWASRRKKKKKKKKTRRLTAFRGLYLRFTV